MVSLAASHLRTSWRSTLREWERAEVHQPQSGLAVMPGQERESDLPSHHHQALNPTQGAGQSAKSISSPQPMLAEAGLFLGFAAVLDK